MTNRRAHGRARLPAARVPPEATNDGRCTVFRILPAAGLLALLAGACAAPYGKPADVTSRLRPSAVDSVTVALYRFDETGGVDVGDAGPFRLGGAAGIDTRTDFGQFGNARQFSRSLDSFVLVPYNPLFNFSGSFSIDAWIYLDDYTLFDAAPIAARWTPLANQQSWFLGIAGYHQRGPVAGAVSGTLDDIAGRGQPGQLVFAFQPEDAAPPRSFVSTRAIQRKRWTHVGATYDGRIVRLYVDGQLDSQSATSGTVRPTEAPLMMGNFFDTRWLGSFGGDLRIEQALDPEPYFALQGLIDDLHISTGARPSFPAAEWR
jgi:hypothetical protein